MYRVLIIETGEYLYESLHGSFLYTGWEVKCSRNEFKIFERPHVSMIQKVINEMRHEYLFLGNGIRLNMTQNPILFEIIEVPDE